MGGTSLDHKTRCALRLLSDGVIVLLACIGTAITVTSRSEGILTSFGWSNLKYYTVDSNLLLGLVCLAELCLAAARRAGRIGRVPPWIDTLYYIAATAVSLTFVVVGVYFGPFVGYAPLYREANLFFHLLIPALAIVSFCALRRRFIPMRETALALIPSVLYGLYYTIVLLRYGVQFPVTDWYGFATGGVAGSIITAAGVLLLTWTLALLLRLAAGGTKRHARRLAARAAHETKEENAR